MTLLRRSPGRTTGAPPNVIVIGAQKCGTSALHYYLGLHPEVQMSSPKELRYFISDQDFEPEPFVDGPAELELVRTSHNWSRGADWYQGHFRSEAPVRGEATPGYASPWFPGVAERMAAMVPDAKLIFLVRDPVERIVSHYVQLREMGREPRTLAQALARPRNPYVGRSSYATLLRPFQERYPRERILLLRQEDLLLRRRETVQKVFGFLGVDPGFWSPKMERERHRSAAKGRRHRALTRLQGFRATRPLYRLPQEVKWVLERASSAPPSDRPAVGEELRGRLLAQLEPEIAAFEQLTGWDLSSWRQAAAPETRERTPQR